jgi:hypothetical protein
MICIQVNTEPDKNNDGEQDKGRPVFHGRKEGQQKNPKSNVIGDPDQREGVGVCLFD